MNNIQITEGELDSFYKRVFVGFGSAISSWLPRQFGCWENNNYKKYYKTLGIEEMVTSPTFNIVRSYKKEDLDIYHVDLYRISSIHEFNDLDLPLFKENTLFFIEWSDLLPTANLDNWRLIKIEVIDENTRKISY